jgi:hypothetical protein
LRLRGRITALAVSSATCYLLFGESLLTLIALSVLTALILARPVATIMRRAVSIGGGERIHRLHPRRGSNTYIAFKVRELAIERIAYKRGIVPEEAKRLYRDGRLDLDGVPAAIRRILEAGDKTPNTRDIEDALEELERWI